jgi:hypothetical protein
MSSMRQPLKRLFTISVSPPDNDFLPRYHVDFCNKKNIRQG